MGKNSAYYKELAKKQKAKISEKKKKLPNYVHSFIDDCELNYQPNTVIAYADDLITFMEYLIDKNPLYRKSQTKDIPLEALDLLTREDINAFQAYLSNNMYEGEHYHASGQLGVARKMATIRNFFEYLESNSYIKSDPTVKAAKGKRKKKDAIVRMDKDEVSELLRVVETSDLASKRARSASKITALRDTAIITLLLNTGIRVSECVGLDLEDVNFNDNSITIVRKGGSTAIIYFNKATNIALQDYILHERNNFIENNSERALFISSQTHTRMAVRTIQYMVKKYSTEAVHGKNISPHKLRSTYGTNLYKKSKDIYMVADVLGHKDVNTTTKHYAAMDDEHRRQAATYDVYDMNE
ncbi:MAG: tyrosine-type recombinase/integrase [Butyrivibrio sp.]|uniref:tyrosine-type recombinase/integrase n=1 Tax=Butyrivibrio sp. TaxID=28121 RepID=UPI001B4B5856|nr:tyrosine-type recombinase/integrase [Butyrivibrio sp.]MBP3784567.1 tyrosine-type recombinase/integrase [Butyrivibrio sp.]